MVDFLQFLISGLVIGSIYGLAGIGFTGIYNVTGVVNFAQGDKAMIGAMLAITFSQIGLPLVVAIFLAVGLTGAMAVVIERFTIRSNRQQHLAWHHHHHRRRDRASRDRCRGLGYRGARPAGIFR